MSFLSEMDPRKRGSMLLSRPLSMCFLDGQDVEPGPASLSHFFMFLWAFRESEFFWRECITLFEQPSPNFMQSFHLSACPFAIFSYFFSDTLSSMQSLNVGIYLFRVLASAVSSPLLTHTLAVNSFRTKPWLQLHPRVHDFHGCFSSPDCSPKAQQSGTGSSKSWSQSTTRTSHCPPFQGQTAAPTLISTIKIHSWDY